MDHDTPLPFDLPAVARKKLTVDFKGGNQSSDGGLLLLREAERGLAICERLAGSMRDLRDASRVQHSLVELIKTVGRVRFFTYIAIESPSSWQ
jgi:hypothetical protein